MRDFRIFQKSKILMGILAAIVIIGSFCWIKQFATDNLKLANATTTSATITDGDRIYYNQGDYGDVDYTSIFSVQTNDGGSYSALCAQPTYRGVDGTYDVASLNNNQIKLMLYIYFKVPNGTEANTIFGSGQTNNYKTVLTHEIVGQLYPDTASVAAAMERLENHGYTSMINKINAAKTQLNSWINNNANVWKEASKYIVYHTVSTSGVQDIVWIAPNAGGLKVKKVDADTNSATPQGDTSSFAGTVFGIYNASGTKVMEITAGNDGVASTGQFDLVLGTYTVKEISTVSSYNVQSNGITVVVDGVNKIKDATGTPIKNAVKKGSINIQKCDANLESCTPQGNANFFGITFTVYNKSTNPVYYNGHSVAKNQVVTTGATGSDGKVSFSNLPYGTYMVKETGSNNGYALSSEEKTITISGVSTNPTLTFKNTILKGKIKIQKCDLDKEDCTPQGAASFAGITFTLYNKSDSPIYYQGRAVAKNEIVATGTTNANGVLEFDDLPYGNYSIKETASNESYLLSNEEKQVTISSANTEAEVVFKDSVVRGDVKFKKISSVNGDGMENIAFEIISEELGERHIVVTDENGIINTSSQNILHSQNTNAYDEMSEYEFAEAGTWFGNGAIVDTVGALPYGTYTIKELECDENFFCEDRDAKKIIEISANGEVVDLGEWENDCLDPELHTTASNIEGTSKEIAPNEVAKIKDVVEYCLKAGEEFRISGVVMDKATGEPMLINGEKVAVEKIFTPEENCGTIEMIFEFNASELGGKDLVIFEKAYLRQAIAEEEFEEKLVAKHENINDGGQTIHVTVRTPNTGLFSGKGVSVLINRTAIFGGGALVIIYLVKTVRRKKRIRF